jgi:4-hydroxy-3-methylbut-2-enyl diphosphate reductase
VPIIPRRWERRLSIHRLKDIPGSKTVSAALAWAFIVAVLPAVDSLHFSPWGTPLAFAYTLILVFVRCALFDILDVQGDLIVGKETIPIVLGETGTLRLITRLNLGLLAALVLLPPLGLVPTLAWCLTLPVLGLLFMQRLLMRAQIVPGAFSEGLVDLNFLLAGALALAWRGLVGWT